MKHRLLSVAMLDVIRAHCPLVNGEGCERGQNAGLLDLEIVQWWNENSDEKLKNWKILAWQRKLLQTVTMSFNVDSALILVGEVVGTVGNWNNVIARLPSPWLALTQRRKEVELAVELVYILTHTKPLVHIIGVPVAAHNRDKSVYASLPTACMMYFSQKVLLASGQNFTISSCIFFLQTL